MAVYPVVCLPVPVVEKSEETHLVECLEAVVEVLVILHSELWASGVGACRSCPCCVFGVLIALDGAFLAGKDVVYCLLRKCLYFLTLAHSVQMGLAVDPESVLVRQFGRRRETALCERCGGKGSHHEHSVDLFHNKTLFRVDIGFEKRYYVRNPPE